MTTKTVEFLHNRYYVGLGDRSVGAVEKIDKTLANGLIAAGLAKEVKPPKEKADESDSK